MVSNLAAMVFVILAISYLGSLFSLIRELKKDDQLWVKLGEPSLMSFAGQRRFDKVLFHPEEIPITDETLLKKIALTKLLMFAGIASFALAALAFFLSGKAGALPG